MHADEVCENQLNAIIRVIPIPLPAMINDSQSKKFISFSYAKIKSSMGVNNSVLEDRCIHKTYNPLNI